MIQLFSALFSMLPTSEEYFVNAGYSRPKAGVLMVAWLVVGFLGIQVVSRLLHRFMPSHVVDCDHSHNQAHGQQPHDHKDPHAHAHSPHRHHSPHTLPRHRRGADVPDTILEGPNGTIEPPSESTPLLVHEHHEHAVDGPRENGRTPVAVTERTSVARPTRTRTAPAYETARRPPMVQVQERVLSFVKDLKSNCDETGPCFGYSDPCGQECFKHVNSRNPAAARRVSLLRSSTGSFCAAQRPCGRGRDGSRDSSVGSPTTRTASAEPPLSDMVDGGSECGSECGSIASEDLEAQHHHHVPTNAFLSIGLQTSIAIALHKFPEGFITYATNHANPSLGFNVFMALLVHNISEGFTIALPLYMALNSRVKALLWAALLGGLSQPMGAAVAALWFRLAGEKGEFRPDGVVYAGLFAITAGIMVSVALQLFVESLSLGHNRNLSIFFGFLGMVVLGVSGALVGEH